MTRPENEDMIAEYDRIVVRGLEVGDLAAITRIDRAVSGRSRADYLQRKVDEALRNSRVRVSLVAVIDENVAGFLMGRIWFGEFGVLEPVAILDTIGVDPSRARQGVGRALYSQFVTNLRGLGIERVETQGRWNDWPLLRFLESQGFHPVPRVHLEARL